MIVTNGYIASADHHLEGGEVLVEGPVPEMDGLLLVALSLALLNTPHQQGGQHGNLHEHGWLHRARRDQGQDSLRQGERLVRTRHLGPR